MMMINNKSEITLIKDSEWSVIEGEPCRVIDFTPWGSVKDGKFVSPLKLMPYASIQIECKKLPGNITGFITNKMDFMHLWAAFKERTIKQNEEVIIFWSKKHYKVKLLKLFSGPWPKLWVMVCRKEAFEIMTDSNYKPELQGEARYNAEKPIIEWKPEIME